VTRRIQVLAMVLGALACGAGQARAQEPPRLEIGAGGGLFGGASLGSRDANLRANSTTGEVYRLFSTDTQLTPAPQFDVRVDVRVARRLFIEGHLGYSRPDLESSVTADAEGAAAVTVVEGIDQYVIDAGILFMVDELRVGRMTPFIVGGAGYLRQLHETQTVVEQGHVFHAGGGIKYPLLMRARGRIRAAGLRADARVYFLSGGIELDEDPRTHTSFSGGFFIGF